MPDDRTRLFHSHRARLYGIAYRMLGSRADAEDLLQDAWLRWQEADTEALRNVEAWLVTLVTHLCIDRLRAAKIEREAYTGPWLPEPVVDEHAASPEEALEFASDVSMAFLLMLERLAPEERAVFLLHDVFDYSHADVAKMVGRNEAACRQMTHRLRKRMREARPRHTINPQAHRSLLGHFIEAARTGRPEALITLLTEEATFTSDGGGKVTAALKVIAGADRVSRFYAGIQRKWGGRAHFELAEVNGEPGLLRFVDGELESVHGFRFEGGRIGAIYVVRNPDKLARIPASRRSPASAAVMPPAPTHDS